MNRSLKIVGIASLFLLACGAPSDPGDAPDAPDQAGGFASWDGEIPVPDGGVAPTPDAVVDGIATEDAEEDTGPTLTDGADSTPPADGATDAADVVEEVGTLPTPCESNEDCVDVEMSGPCMAPACNPASGTCIEIFRAVGTPCDTGDLCKSGQVCQGGECTGGTSLSCVDEDVCTTDLCLPDQGCVFEPVVDCCIPDCEGKVCGSDGCGGSCGGCDPGWSCNTAGTCINCVPNCLGLTCGADGCGGVCGVCPVTWFCIDPGICTDCLPECEGKQCGPDGCGSTCGSCGANTFCDGAICTDCLPDCEGKQCGTDGCGGTCGNCAGNASCTFEGVCECTADCDGKVCGDNGCGGTCGSCPVGEVCSFSNQCQAVVSAMTCDNPLIIPGVPFNTIQNTSGAPNLQEMPAGICGFTETVGGASPEHVYSFTPQVSGTFTFQVTPWTFDAAVYLVADCSGASVSCLIGSNEPIEEVLSVPLIAEKTYFLVVDGANNLEAAEGQYEFSAYAGPPVNCTVSCEGKECGTDGCGGSCGTCTGGQECTVEGTCEFEKPGDTCDLPVIVDTMPFTSSGDTGEQEPDYDISSGSCTAIPPNTGKGGSDIVYTYAPATTGNYLITVPTVWDLVVYVVTDCEAISDSCVGFSDDAAVNSPEELVVYLMAGETYYIILDGSAWNENLNGEYTFKIEPHVPENCDPSCGGAQCGPNGCGGYCGACSGGLFCEAQACVTSLQGDSCGTAFEVGALPFQTSGDTTGSHADYSFSMDGCPGKDGGWGLKGSDQVFHLQAPTSGTYQIDVEVQYDALVYLVTNCADIDGTCIEASDEFGQFTESITASLQQGTDYFIIIDYWSNTSDGTGAYELFVDQTCQSDCLGASCGSDGCGGSCGQCNAGEVCAGGACAATAIGGESCTSPIEFTLGLGTFYANGDTTGASSDVTHEMMGCQGDGKSGDGPDHVYAVTALQDATYTVTLTIPEDNLDLGLWVAVGCDDVDFTCITESDALSFAGSSEVVDFPATAGTTYYVIVDSSFTEPPMNAGPYSLEFLAE